MSAAHYVRRTTVEVAAAWNLLHRAPVSVLSRQQQATKSRCFFYTQLFSPVVVAECSRVRINKFTAFLFNTKMRGKAKHDGRQLNASRWETS